MKLREYQQAAVDQVFREWETARSVCLVLQTGGGKTETSMAIIERAGLRTLFTVHRKELLRQSFERLGRHFGPENCGVVAAGWTPNPGAQIQIAMLQTLVARDARPDAQLVVHDECHHLMAEDFREVVEHYSHARWLGLTATPERADGKPLGDLFERLVVGSNYSMLLNQGYLVPCKVFRANFDDEMGEGVTLAQHPVTAYERHARGTQAIAFCPNVKLAYEQASEFTMAGYPAECIEANTDKGKREIAMRRFREGSLRVLTNVNIMTEGLDLPSVETVILGRAFRHVSAYLQAVGRVLRPAPGKSNAICIDLTGASYQHGLPTENRAYSLEGEGIRRITTEALTTCQECGATYEGRVRICPCCGFERPCKTPKPPRIYSLELQEIWAGEDTPSEAKDREWQRLMQFAENRGYGLAWAAAQYEKCFGEKPNVEVPDDAKLAEIRKLVARCLEKGWSLSFAVKRYRETFKADPDMSWVPREQKDAEFARLNATAAERGYKPGWAAYQYKAAFGAWPRRA
jgi:DNA repair protein RadD